MPAESITDAPAAGMPPAAPAAPSAPERSLIPGAAPVAPAAPAGAVAETWWKGWIKETGELDVSRLNHLPEELKGSQAVLARFKKADDFFKSFAHAQQLVSQKGLTPLREGASPEEVTDHMKRMALVNGTPEKPEGYGIKHESPEVQKQYDEFAKVFHKHALSPSAVKDLVALNESLQKAQMEAYETERARAEDAAWKEMEKEIDREFGAFKAEKFAAARSGARWMGLDPDSPAFKQNAKLIIAAAKVGEKIGEAKFVDGGSAEHGTMAPEDELKDMGTNPANKYYDILRNPGKNPRLAQEAYAHQLRLGERIAAKKARQG